MATHSSILAWEIPWTEEPGGLQSTELQKSQKHLSNWAWAWAQVNIHQNSYYLYKKQYIFLIHYKLKNSVCKNHLFPKLHLEELNSE